MASIEVDPKTLSLGIATGQIRHAGKGEYELTPKGEEYLRAWLAEKLEEHEATQTDT